MRGVYLELGEELRGSDIELTYSFHRLLTSDVLFWVAVIGCSKRERSELKGKIK